jgi:hypothetical protein
MARNFSRTSQFAGQYIDCGTDAALNPANNFSLACWVRFSTFPTGGYVAQFLITRDATPNGRCYSLALYDYQGTPHTLAFTVFKNGSSFTTVQDTVAVTAGTWLHVVATYQFVADGTSVLRLYKNGSQVASSSNAVGPCVTATTNTLLGYRAASSQYPLNGQLAEAAIYNVTLSASDAAALATGASPRLVRPDGLVMYAPLVRELLDLRGTATLTNNGTTVTDHPRIYS